MSEILQRFISALEIKGGNDYIIRYSTDENIGLGYKEMKELHSALYGYFPNNKFIFIPSDCEIKNYDKQDLLDLKTTIENFLEEKEKEEA